MEPSSSADSNIMVQVMTASWKMMKVTRAYVPSKQLLHEAADASVCTQKSADMRRSQQQLLTDSTTISSTTQLVMPRL
jgi:hypothetical protein